MSLSRKKREATREKREGRQARLTHQRQRAKAFLSEREDQISHRLAQKETEPDDPLSQLLRKKAPKLLKVKEYKGALDFFLERSADYVRPLADWKPRGKGAETLFRNLCDHLWARYPVPHFVWNILSEEATDQYRWLALEIGAGGSLFKASKEGRFPVKLTRAMVHELMTTASNMNFLGGVRQVQVKAAGGDRRLFSIWRKTQQGAHLGDSFGEAFWGTVLEWFARNPMLDPTQVGPLLDFIRHRRTGAASFSMKGRSVLAMMRGMREWHAGLAATRVTSRMTKRTYPPSGLKELTTSQTRKKIRTTWHIRELLSTEALIDEGRILGHCAASYNLRIGKSLSLWSLSLKEEADPRAKKKITLEVSGDRIVQARGYRNRPMVTQELQVVTQWAAMNRLEIDLGRWG